MQPQKQRTRRDWSALPSELLEVIADNFTAISDISHFRSVCRPWRTISSIFTNLHSHLPWLVLDTYQHYTNGYSNSSSTLRHLFSPSFNRLYTFRLPNQYSSGIPRIFGSSSFGYVLIVRNYCSFYIISLFNPFTGSHIVLPRLPLHHGNIMQGKLVQYDQGFLVTVYSRSSRIFLCCCTGDSDWTEMDFICRCIDFAYHGANLFVSVLYNTPTVIINPTNTMNKISIPSPGIDYPSLEYFAESSSGELLMVVYTVCEDSNKRFQVFQLDQCEQPRWVKVKSIGDDALFVGDSSAMCFAAGNFEGCRGNCIYFWEKNIVGLFDIGDDSVEKLPCKFGELLPGTNPDVFWVMPSL